MPWNEVTIVSQRKEFIALAQEEKTIFSHLCRQFSISRKTGYKWLKRYKQHGERALVDQSRRPAYSPRITNSVLETKVIELRKTHTSWGGRKIKKRLHQMGLTYVPAASTITCILTRHGMIDAVEAVKHKPYLRFEANAPNDLWQMDFKGHFACHEGRCHPLSVLDDHSRYAVGLQACPHQQGTTVKAFLSELFRHYGLPHCILADNGSPWGSEAPYGHTPLTIWLLRLGVKVIHGRPYHPQTQGKVERFHRTLKAEVLKKCGTLDLKSYQKRFNTWRNIYNFQRPHEALGLEVPASRYSKSVRSFPEKLPEIEYRTSDLIRKVHVGGYFTYRSVRIRVSKALRGQYIALRPTELDGQWEIYFSKIRIGQFNIRNYLTG